MSDRGDNITEANLQADGLREEPLLLFINTSDFNR